MDEKIIALFVTLVLGIFVGIGALLAVLTKRQAKILDFIMGLAFSLLLMLVLTDLLPEVMNVFGIKYLWAFIVFVRIGFFLLKLLDYFIPNHHDTKMTKQEEKSNIIHIGILSVIALILHNIIEGMAVYSTACKSISLGTTMALGIGLHNVPLGMVITSVFYQAKQKGYTPFLYIFLFALSSFFGGFFLFILHVDVLNDFIVGIFLSLTIGMLLYIIFFELCERIFHTKNKSNTICGMIVGIVLLLFTFLLR